MGRGDQLFEEVQKLEKKKPLFGKKAHQEKLCDKMVQCANAFRAERDFPKAGELYAKAAKLYEALEDIPSACKAAADAVKMYAKDSQYHTEAIDAIHHGVDLFKSRDRHQDAANLLAEFVKILLEQGEKDEAFDIVNEAVDLYKQARCDARAGSFLEESADLFLEAGGHAQASDFYLQAAEMRLENSITQGSSGIIFQKCMLAYLQGNDMVGAQRRLDEYLDKNPAWRNDMACKFVVDLIKAISARDIEAYDAALEKYKPLTMMNKWLTDRVYDLRGLADGGASSIL